MSETIKQRKVASRNSEDVSLMRQQRQSQEGKAIKLKESTEEKIEPGTPVMSAEDEELRKEFKEAANEVTADFRVFKKHILKGKITRQEICFANNIYFGSLGLVCLGFPAIISFSYGGDFSNYGPYANAIRSFGFAIIFVWLTNYICNSASNIMPNNDGVAEVATDILRGIFGLHACTFLVDLVVLCNLIGGSCAPHHHGLVSTTRWLTTCGMITTKVLISGLLAFYHALELNIGGLVLQSFSSSSSSSNNKQQPPRHQ